MDRHEYLESLGILTEDELDAIRCYEYPRSGGLPDVDYVVETHYGDIPVGRLYHGMADAIFSREPICAKLFYHNGVGGPSNTKIYHTGG